MADDTLGFLGRGWGFPPQFDIATAANGRKEARPLMVDGPRDIEESLEILLFTLMGERVMRPTYGLGLQADVFDSTDETSLTYLRSRIEKAVVFFEDRIVLREISFDTDAILDGYLGITLDYDIPAINSRANKVFPYYFREGTALSADRATGSPDRDARAINGPGQ